MSVPRFFIQKSAIEQEFIRLHLVEKELKIDWTNYNTFASYYPSKYAAKKHLKFLQANFKLPESVTIVEMERK